MELGNCNGHISKINLGAAKEIDNGILYCILSSSLVMF